MDQNKSSTLRVCLCGRPNVGKSSLYNRMIGRRKALVLDEPGVTRDVYRSQLNLFGREIEIADLAGLEENWHTIASTGHHFNHNKAKDEALLKKLSTEAALDYLETADLILFVIDGRSVLTPADEELARLVRSHCKRDAQILPILSKIEGNLEAQAQLEAVQLGFGQAHATSAEHNIGVEALKEIIAEKLFGEDYANLPEIPEQMPKDQTEAETNLNLDQEKNFERGLKIDRPIRLGVYGRPNVGKSTLVNFLLGEKRMITSPIAGTTVDTVDSDFQYNQKFYRILDTAGIRKKSKTEQGVEVLSVVAALKSIDHVDVALFLVDGFEGITDQDEKIAGQLINAGKPIILIINKWDTCRVKREDYAERLRKEFAFLDFAPILFISAEKGEGIDALWDLISEILKQRFVIAPTGELNRFIEIIEGTNNPTGVKLYYASQTAKNPPTITFMVSSPDKIHFAYERFLKNELRQRYGWMGSPLKLVFKARKRSAPKKDGRQKK